jgi:hypothetical protein
MLKLPVAANADCQVSQPYTTTKILFTFPATGIIRRAGISIRNGPCAREINLIATIARGCNTERRNC